MVRRVDHKPLHPRTPSTLSDHAILGDGHSAALVSGQGAVDFWCPQRFDADSAFLRLLDPGGGALATAPAVAHRVEVGYLPNTNIHRVRMKTRRGTLLLTTAMAHAEAGHRRDARRILRLVSCEDGPVEMTLSFTPTLRYGAKRRVIEWRDDAALASGPDDALMLRSTLDLPSDSDACEATYRLEPGETHAIVLEHGDAPRVPKTDVLTETEDVLERESSYWRDWLGRSDYEGVYKPEVVRSLLTLKLLQHVPTGSFVASPTFGLPSRPGGPDNWDYRYTWLRDSAFIVMSFETVGMKEEALRFRRWLARVVKRDAPDDLKPLYCVNGDPVPPETELGHLQGYLRSRPVRVGNRAGTQQQLDAYGDVMICFHRAPVLWQEEGRDLWTALAAITDHALAHWREPESGIWELPQLDQWTYSKGMAWLAFDRMIEISEKQGFEVSERWAQGKRDVEAWLDSDGTDARGAFLEAPQSRATDGATLLFPIFGITPPDDPRVEATLAAVEEDLVSHGLAHRFLLDGEGSEAAFLAVNFWMAQDLAALGRPDEARRAFEAATRVASPLGLLPEQADPITGAGLGNHPLGLSHYSLVLAADALNRATG